MKKITIIILMLNISFAFSQMNTKISKEHNDGCFDIIKNSEVNGMNSFDKNYKKISEYVFKKHNVKIQKLSKEKFEDPYKLLEHCKTSMSNNLYVLTKQVLDDTKNKSEKEFYAHLEKMVKDINTYKLEEKEKIAFNDMLSIFYGSMSFWQSKEVKKLMKVKGLWEEDIKLNNSKQSENRIFNLWPEPDDYWKIAAADFVGSFAGLWAGPGGAVGSAIICSINNAL